MRFVIRWYKTAVFAAAMTVLPGFVGAQDLQQNMDVFDKGNSNCDTEFTSDGPYVFYKKVSSL